MDNNSLSTPQLAGLKNIYLGSRCFIIANGPSLLNHDLKLLTNEFKFILNRGNQALEHGLTLSLCANVVSDYLTFEAYADEIMNAQINLMFFRSDVANRDSFKSRKSSFLASSFIFPYHNENTIDLGYFSEDLLKGVHRGFTVALDAIQIAYYMGFRKIYILGCDLDYTQEKMHFYGNGAYEYTRRNDMPIEKVLKAFNFAYLFLKNKNTYLYNASEFGRLDTIPRINYRLLF